MTEQEINDLINQIEIAVNDKVESKIKERFDSFCQFVESAYSFHTADRTDEKLIDENGDKITIDDKTDFSIFIKPNPNFNIDNDNSD